MSKKSEAEQAVGAEVERDNEWRKSRTQDLQEAVTEERDGSTVHTYPDGSQVVGRPPFPDKSPLELAAEQRRNEGAKPPTPMFIPPGTPLSGEKPPVAGAGVTSEQLAAQAGQQLQSDVVSGKDPNTINPTTASDKPELAGTSGTIVASDLEQGLTLDDPKVRDEIAAQIEPSGNIEASEDEKNAAVAQVIRENKGTLVEESDTSDSAKKSKK